MRINEDYDLVKVIKKSERGSVSVIRSKATGEQFVFRKTDGGSEVYRKLMTVSCPNLPRIISVEESEDEVFVIEEYVRGDTLYYLLEGGVLSEEETMGIILQLCKGLEALHRLGVVHRDIKPENIIIRGREAVLIDFDASRMVDPEKETNSDTKILGTMGYASPEQYGLSQTDARSDIYSVGVLMNVMLTGEHPSTRFVSGEMGEIIQKCTMISPEKRYQSNEELEKALSEIRIRKKKKTMKRFFGALAAAAIFAAAGIFFSSVQSEFIFKTIANKILGTEILQEELFPAEILTLPQDIADGTEWLELSGWEKGTGKSDILPEEFYRYWSGGEIISANQIKISAPGNIENYLSYEFSDDVLKITVDDIPEEEWKRAYGEFGGGEKEFCIELLISAPKSSISWIASDRGGSEGYKTMKLQSENGIKFKYEDFDPETDFVSAKTVFATVVNEDTGIVVKTVSDDAVRYVTVFWKDGIGRIITRIIPYMIILSEEGGDSLEEAKYATWMDAVWQPISDPERLVYKNVNNGDIFKAEYLDNRGIELSVFKEPGYILCVFSEDEKVDVDILANLEAIILPPDARAQEDGESIDEYLESVYAETEYAGFKVNSTNVDRSFSYGILSVQLEIIESSKFCYVNENGYSSVNLIPMDIKISGSEKVWHTNSTGTIIIIIDWYKENPDEKPDAVPAAREYLYSECGSFTMTENE